MKKRQVSLKNDQKGFTLVELIVVLVILAIMAALLAPALLGYIDKARTSKYLEECRSISTAVQAILDEHYAKNSGQFNETFTDDTNADKKELNDLVYPTVVTAIDIDYMDDNDAKKKYIVKDIKSVSFTSQDGEKAQFHARPGQPNECG